jgi:uncharacterized protein YkwD
MRTHNPARKALQWLAVAGAVAAAGPARSQPSNELITLINAYRAAPGKCEGSQAAPLPPLVPQPALARVQIGTGTFLELALERAGYAAEHAEAINISGPGDASTVMSAIRDVYCRALLNADFSAAGAVRRGDNWQIVLAQPARPSPLLTLPDSLAAGRATLNLVNRARAEGRICGERSFPPAPPLVWNTALGEAALAHSRDMAAQRYFSHQGKDGSFAAERATAAGYRWRKIGENIAAGQDSPEEAVAGWLASPGHCANIMQGEFTEMGAAYGIDSERKTPRVYWTQVFGTPR